MSVTEFFNLLWYSLEPNRIVFLVSIVSLKSFINSSYVFCFFFFILDILLIVTVGIITHKFNALHYVARVIFYDVYS